MHRTIGSLFTFFFLFSSSFAFCAQAPQIKLATLAPKGTIYHKLLMKMAEAWRTAPGGGARLVIYPDGVLGGESDVVRGMRIGKIQAAMMTAAGLERIDSSVAALQSIPMLYRSLEEARYVRKALLPTIEEAFRAKGYELLVLSDAGWIRFFSNRPAPFPADFRKLKIFAGAGDPKAMEVWKACGCQPVALEATDMLTALKTGLIDAVPVPPNYALAGQIFNPAPHMLDLRWVPLVGGIIVTRSVWETFPPETQQAMKRAAEEAGEGIMAESLREENEAIEAMKKRGLQVHPATEEIIEAWKKNAEEAYPLIRGTIVPADLFDRVVQLLAEYRSGKTP